MAGTRTVRDRRGRRAVAWGSGIVLAGFALGCTLSFLPVASGIRWNPPFGLELVVALGSLVVGIAGIGLSAYGIVELVRARPSKQRRRPSA
jgi:hypothetical protein